MDLISDGMNDSQKSKVTGEAAWQPDIAEALSRSSDTSRFSGFRPVERANNRFVAHDDFLAQIVVGGRGMGKSTLLTYRMRHLRRRKDACNFVRDVPPFGFRLINRGLKIPLDGLGLYSKAETWSSLWLVVLGLLFGYATGRSSPGMSPRKPEDWMKHFGVDSPSSPLGKTVAKLAEWGQDPHQETLHEVIQPLLDAKASSSLLRSYFEEHVQPALQKPRRNPAKIECWVLFVDNIDEALSDHNGMRRVLEDGVAAEFATNDGITAENAAVSAHELWVNAQAGYAQAAHQLRQLKGSVQMIAYGSARSEAYKKVLEVIGLTESKISDFLHRLERDEDQLRDIFALNVSLMLPSQKVKVDNVPDSHEKACQELCGHSRLAARSVFGEEESVFDLMRRHNFGTPRGLMLLGQSIRKLVSSTADHSRAMPMSPSAVVTAVNQTAAQVFTEYRDTLYPPWNRRYDAGLKYVTSNVITQSEAKRIESNFAVSDKGIEPLFKYLYRVGLVGIPRMDPDQRTVQGFWLPGDDPVELPDDYGYLLVHPAMAAFIYASAKREVQATFYSRTLLVNPGAHCQPKLIEPALSLRLQKDEGDGPQAVLSSTQSSTPQYLAGHKVGGALLMTLLVAQRSQNIHEPLHREVLTSVAEALCLLGFISDRLGKRPAPANQKGSRTSTPAKRAKKSAGEARQTLTEFFSSLCNNELHSEASDQATAVVDANALLEPLGAYKVRGDYEESGNGYDIWRTDDPVIRLSRARIEIIGLSGLEYRTAYDSVRRRSDGVRERRDRNTRPSPLTP